MNWEYTGYLKELLYAPDPDMRDQVDAIVLSAQEIGQWATRDLLSDVEWQKINATRSRKGDAVRLVGRFDDVLRMDNIPVDQPSFWVPLSSMGWKDEHFPVDTTAYSIFEITYRCTSDNAVPKVAWLYPGGGINLFSLPQSREWRTVVRRIPHLGFPGQLDAMVIRLYSPTRTTESMEIQSICFRAMSPTEAEAVQRDNARLLAYPAPRHYPVLEQFLPIGVKMDAAVARRLGDMLGVTLSEYWGLALEDIVKHHHNCIWVDNVDRLTAPERDELLAVAESYGIKVVVTHNYPGVRDPQEWREIIESDIVPYADSDVVLVWILSYDPSETDLPGMLIARDLVQEVDERHPLAVSTRYPSVYPAYARHFAISGFSYPTSHAPRVLGQLLQTHLPLFKGQQNWVDATTLVTATGTPEWSSCPELRLMVNLSFACGARGWFSNAYHNDPIWAGGSCERSLTGPFLTFSDLWSELDLSMERYNALAPMLLYASPDRAPDIENKYIMSKTAGDRDTLPEGVSPTSAYRLRGMDYTLYCVVSNDARGMTTLNMSIPAADVRSIQLYDITDFVRTRRWGRMELERNIEMFPGEVRIVLAGEQPVCDYWRNAIAARLIEDDRRQLGFSVDLAHAYNLDTSAIRQLIDSVGEGGDIMKLEIMGRAYHMLVDLTYSCPAIAEPRSNIIDTSAAVCACDGVLCRMMGRGRSEQAHELGLRVIPMAREFTNLRVELRRGRGAAIVEQTRDLKKRCHDLLTEIRKAGLSVLNVRRDVPPQMPF